MHSYCYLLGIFAVFQTVFSYGMYLVSQPKKQKKTLIVIMMTQHLTFILPVVTTAFQQQKLNLVLYFFGTIIEQKFFRIIVLTFGMRKYLSCFLSPLSLNNYLY
jgi:hypothetical protein